MKSFNSTFLRSSFNTGNWAKALLMLVVCFALQSAEAQCPLSPRMFPGIAVPSGNTSTPTTISNLQLAGDNATVSGVTAGGSYTISAPGQYITVYTSAGVLIAGAFGLNSVTFTNPAANTSVRVQFTASGPVACATGNTVFTSTIACNSGCLPGACPTAVPLVAGTPVTIPQSAANIALAAGMASITASDVALCGAVVSQVGTLAGVPVTIANVGTVGGVYSFGDGVLYSFTVPAGTTSFNVSATSTAFTFDPWMALWSATTPITVASCSGLSFVGGVDDVTGQSGSSSITVNMPNSAVTYYLYVGVYGAANSIGDPGAITLTLNPPTPAAGSLQANAGVFLGTCPAPTVTTATVTSVTACNTATSTYNVNFNVAYTGLVPPTPASGVNFLVVNGQRFPVTTVSPQGVIVTGLPSNGLPSAATTAYFEGAGGVVVGGVVNIAAGAWTAPAACNACSFTSCPTSQTLNLGAGQCTAAASWTVPTSTGCASTLTSFTGPFANVNPFGVVAGASNSVTASTTNLVIVGGTAASTGAQLVMPSAGSFAFSYNFNGTDPNFDFFQYYVNGVPQLLPLPNGITNPGAANVVIQNLNAGDVVSFVIFADGVAPNTAQVTINALAFSGNSVVTQTAGPLPGTQFPIGTTTVSYQLFNILGQAIPAPAGVCSFSVTVNGYPASSATTTMTCNNLVNISLDDSNCAAGTTVTADMILNGDNYRCYNTYTVSLSNTMAGPFNIPPVLTPSMVGTTIFVQVLDPITNNRCWGQIKIEDKEAPKLTRCNDVTIACTESIAPDAGPVVANVAVTSTLATAGAITNNGVTTFPVSFSGLPANATINSVTLPINITGSRLYNGNVSIALQSPSGSIAILLDPTQAQIGGCAAITTLNTIFSSTGIAATLCSQFSGLAAAGVVSVQPYGGASTPTALNVFNGQNINGTWNIIVTEKDATVDALNLIAASVRVNYSVNTAYSPLATDCSAVTRLYSDVETTLPCTGGPFSKRITRSWRFTDVSGNFSTCVQNIFLTRATLSNVVCPASLDGINGRPTLSCDGIKQSVANPYTVTIPTLVTIPTQHGGWALDCGSSSVVVSNAPVQNYTCDQIPFYIDQNGLIVRAKLTPTNVYLPNPSTNLNWAKLANGYPSPVGSIAYLNGVQLSGGVLLTGANAFGSAEAGFVGMGVYKYLVNGVAYYFMGSGEPTGVSCGTIGFTYNDSRIDVCGQGFKILREWKILDWCTGAIQTCTQIIKVLDTTGPSIVCPANFTASTDPTVCTGTVVFPAPTLSDNCDASPTYDVAISASLLGTVTRVSAPGATPVVFSGFPIGTGYVITYKATDNCGNISTCTTLMDVQDLVPPNPICREFTQVALGQNGQTKMAAIRFDAGSYDNCGIVKYQVAREIPAAGACRTSVQANAPTGMGTGLGAPADAMAPFGYTPFRDSAIFFCCDVTDTVNVILRVYDRFVSPGNPSNRFNDCMVQVFVEDKLAPSIVCPPNVTVECGAYDFATSALDSAYMDTYFGSVKNTEAARITRTVNTINSLGITIPFALKDGIAYDNCDVTIKEAISNNLATCGSGTINRIFTARDKGGRTISCTQVITVQNLHPFYITDTNPNNNDPQDGVIWPADITLTVCGSQANPDSLAAAGNPNARPTIFEDGCDIVAVSYTDETFVIQAPACYKILRKWSIIDWCAYNAFQAGATNRTWRWNYTQVIKILNNTAPNFTSGCQDQAFYQNPVNCAPLPITLSVTATDDCTGADGIKYSYTIDPNNDGSAPFITGVGSSVTGTFPFGTHRITWSVEDGCGNVRTCSYRFKVEETKKPTPICHIALGEIMPSSGMLPISAAHINNTSYDNCAVQYIKVRRTDSGAQACIPDARIPNPPVATGNVGVDKAALNAWAQQWLVNTQPDGSNADTVVFTCQDRVCGGGVGTLELWVGDNNGNWDYCSTAVTLQNNMNAPGCDQAPGGTGTIAGDIHTEANAMVKDVSLKATSNNPVLTALTQTAGTFNWSAVLGGTYTVIPEKDVIPTNGVTTYDLVQISKHILGIKLLDSPYKMIAADVNKSGTITTFDMVQLRKLILRIDANFTNNTSWRFVDAAYVFPDPLNPFASAFPETVTANVIPAAVSTAKFMGVKIGDVDGSANSQDLLGTEEHNAVGDLTFSMNDVTAKSGETFTFNVKAKDLSAAQGYQFTMNYNKSAMDLVNVAKGELKDLTEDNFGIITDESAITTSWNGKTEGVNPDAVLFSMTFRAKSDLQLSKVLSVSSKITRAEAYTKAGEELNVVFAFNGANGTTIVSENFELFQNTPNPVRNETVIGFNLPTATAATLSIFDVSGKLIKTVEVSGVKGFNQVTLDRTDLKGTGVMKYQLKTANNTATKSMIIVE